MGGLLPNVFEENNADGIDFFARGTSGNPHADRAILGLAIAEQIREHLFAQRPVGLGVAEESCHVDQNVLVELIELAGSALYVAQVVVQLFKLVKHHPALDAALQGRLFVVREVHPRGFPDQREELIQPASLIDPQ